MEQDTKKREAQQINMCCAGPFPAFVEDAEDELEDGQFKVPLEEEVKTPLNEDDEPLVMFFGLTNSSATFQTIMDNIFDELISKGVVVVYLDDILIFTETLKEH